MRCLLLPGRARSPEPYAAEYTARTGATAPLRAGEAAVLREWICPGCARLLETEVTLAGTPVEDDVRPDFWASPGTADPSSRQPG